MNDHLHPKATIVLHADAWLQMRRKSRILKTAFKKKFRNYNKNSMLILL